MALPHQIQTDKAELPQLTRYGTNKRSFITDFFSISDFCFVHAVFVFYFFHDFITKTVTDRIEYSMVFRLSVKKVPRCIYWLHVMLLEFLSCFKLYQVPSEASTKPA